MKRIFTIAVVLMLILSLSGCSMGGGAFDFLIRKEATEFTDQDVKFLRQLYHIPNKIDATFIKSKYEPDLLSYQSETFFYIYAYDHFDAVKLYVNTLLSRECWRECHHGKDFPKHSFVEFKFDDGLYYTPVIQLDHSMGGCALVIYENKRKELYKEPDKYLVYVKTPETVEALSKMKAVGVGNMAQYQSIYGLITD